MATNDDAFTAVAKSLDYTFRAKSGPTWIAKWGFVTDEPGFDPRFDYGAQLGGWYYGVKAYGGHGLDLGEPEAKKGACGQRLFGFCRRLGHRGVRPRRGGHIHPRVWRLWPDR